jgi:hypothetical protein
MRCCPRSVWPVLRRRFAATIGAFAIVALVIGARYGGAAAVETIQTPG